MNDPESDHAALVSGDPGGIRDLALAIFRSAESLNDAADRIAHGTEVPAWQGAAAIAFRIVGQNTYVAAAGTSWHVSRAGDFVTAAANRYDLARADADKVIRFWRQRDPALTPAQVELLSLMVRINLAAVSRAYGRWLAHAGRSLHRDGGKRFEKWLTTGLGKDYHFKAVTGASTGSRIPDSLMTGEDYVPQGLGYDPERGWTFHTSYRGHEGDRPDDSRLTILDHETGREITDVQLAGPRGDAPPNHSGGVAVIGDNVYVVGGGKLYTYDIADIQGAGKGGEVRPIRAPQDVPGSSYVSSQGGRLYLGQFSDPGKSGDGYHGDDKGALYEYDPGTGQVLETYQTPEGANGVVVQDGTMTYAVNGGRYDEGALVTYEHQDGATGDKVSSVDIANMPEEITLINGQIVVSSESGARPYSPFDDDSDGKVTDSDRLSELWAQTSLTDVPLAALAPGFEVEPPSLDEASREFGIASELLEESATAIHALSLAPSLLGQVPAAGAFAAKVDSYLDQAATNIDLGTRTAGGLGEGLLAQMRTYEDVDDGLAAGWGAFGGLLDGGAPAPVPDTR